MIDSVVTSALNGWPVLMGIGVTATAYVVLAGPLLEIRDQLRRREREVPPAHRFRQ
jgi:hypothetical protein